MSQSDQNEDNSAASSMQDYCERGRLKAENLGNRGPIRFDKNGHLDESILEAYHRTGFYVFTEVLSTQEVKELLTEFDQILDNAPVSIKSKKDQHGRSVKFPGYYSLSPRSKAQTKEINHNPGEVTQPDVVGLVSHPLMMMDSALCVYGHPQILKMVAGVNGPDFVPFHEAVFHKGAGEGPPTPWHQDGRTHWNAQGKSLETFDRSSKSHGFNLSISCTPCTPANCLWVVPGSQRHWRLANEGKFPSIKERLPDAVPMMLEPGDCGMVNRSSLHGSYPNHSGTRRVTLLLGFHRRDSAIGAETTNVHAFKSPNPQMKKTVKYTEDYVLRRTRMIPLAIDARRQKYPDEVPYDYTGSYLGDGVWNDKTRAEISEESHEYWQQDITL